MLNCLIVDDEPHNVRLIQDYVQETPFLNLVLATTDVVQAIDWLHEKSVDILFLDINMPVLTGFQFLKVAKPTCHVVIITAYHQHAVESYEYNVADYLVKPISYERFLRSATKVLNRITDSIPPPPESPDKNFIFVKTERKGKFQKINLDEIRYIEGMLNYVSIYTTQSDKPYITYLGIGDMESKLPQDRFARVHRSYIVALKEIEAVDGNEVIMRSSPRIPTGDKYKQVFFKKFESSIVNNPNKDC